MILEEISQLKQTLAKGQRLLGLDVGSKTIGLALSDASLLVASPLETLKRGRIGPAAQELGEIIHEHDIGGLVLGLPLSLDGSEGPACQSVRQFGYNLDQRLDTVIGFWDERLSTAAVERFLVEEADMSRERRARLVDKMAAAYILQGALDALTNMRD
ncbi:MAG: Holliday junction resolvase RuvX [Rhodospirillales bacterium]|jgi:putative Holliday junction resolvase|nr:Holliday junction resolvase RuvX [Rhodospirillales bacterium]